MNSEVHHDFRFSMRIALISCLIALGIDGLIRVLRYLPILIHWLSACG